MSNIVWLRSTDVYAILQALLLSLYLRSCMSMCVALYLILWFLGSSYGCISSQAYDLCTIYQDQYLITHTR